MLLHLPSELTLFDKFFSSSKDLIFLLEKFFHLREIVFGKKMPLSQNRTSPTQSHTKELQHDIQLLSHWNFYIFTIQCEIFGKRF